MHSTTRSVPISNGSVRIRVADCSGEPLLLLHGGPGGTDYLFKFFAVAMRDAGYRAVGMIQRGSPGSPCPGPFTVPAMVEDLEAVRKDLGTETFALLGHSWGGLLGTCYAATFPNRVDRLVLICPMGPRAGWREWTDRTIEQRLTPESRRRCEELLRQAKSASSRTEYERLMVQRQDIRVRESYYSPVHRDGKPGLAGLAWNVYEDMQASLDQWYRYPQWETGLQRLDCPCAVLSGKDDVVPQFAIDDYAEMLPDPQMIALENCGHFPWMEERDAFWKAIDRVL
jgi:proline iminopeptidase